MSDRLKKAGKEEAVASHINFNGWHYYDNETINDFENYDKLTQWFLTRALDYYLNTCGLTL